MTKIKNLPAYPIKQIPDLSDFMVGTEKETGDTRSFDIQGIINAVNGSSGNDMIQYKFSDGSNPAVEYTTEGYFFTDTNDVEVGSFTKLILNKTSTTATDLSVLLEFLGGRNDIIIQLKNPSDPNNFFTFKITSFENDTDYFKFTVSQLSGLYIGELVNDRIYSFYWDVVTNQQNLQGLQSVIDTGNSASIDSGKSFVSFFTGFENSRTSEIVTDNIIGTNRLTVDAGKAGLISIIGTAVGSITSGGGLVKLSQEIDPSNKTTIDFITPNGIHLLKAPAKSGTLAILEDIGGTFIKSNESLSLANRKDDTLYGILDQYTGEEIILNKINFTPYLVDNIIYFQLGAEYFKREYFNGFKITWFGAIGDDFTDNTLAIQKCVDYIFSLGNDSETILVPKGVFITDPITIPYFTGSGDKVVDKPVIFRGENSISHTFGTVGVAVLGDSGGILKCLSTDAGKSVIQVYAPGDSFSNINLEIYNLEIRTYENSIIGGIDGSNAQQMIVDNVIINTNVYSVQSIEPTTVNSSALITPKIDNAALTSLKNISISGYYNGLVINEHTVGDNINIVSCINGYLFKRVNHSSYFNRIGAYRNRYNLTFEGVHDTIINILNIEHAANSQVTPSTEWQKTIYDLNDPATYARGRLVYHTVKGEVGEIGEFFVNGGSAIAFSRLREGIMPVFCGYNGGGFSYLNRLGDSDSRQWDTRTDLLEIGDWGIRRESAFNNKTMVNVLTASKSGQITIHANSPIIPNATLSNQSVALGQLSDRILTSSSSTITLSISARVIYMVYKGTGNVTWNLPSLVSSDKIRYVIINKSVVGIITLNSNLPNEIWDSGTLTSSTICSPGGTMELYNDSESFDIL